MGLIEDLYLQELGRAADAEGLAYWQSLLNQGVSGADIRAGIESSAEGRAYDINDIYQDELGRAADPDGYNYWLGKLNSGDVSVMDVRRGINDSTEGTSYDTAQREALNANVNRAAAGVMPSQPVAPYREALAYQQMSNGDYESLQKALYEGSTAGLDTFEKRSREQADQSASNRGIWSSGLAERMQGDVTERIAPLYQQAGANATAQRYAMQNADLNNLNNYNLNTSNAYNQYQLGLQGNNNNAAQIANSYQLGLQGNNNSAAQIANSYQLGLQGNANQLQQINDSYALNRAQMLNDANAQASQAQWQAQWTPANFLSGVWNGTGGTISSGSSGGGWNFMI